MKRILLSGLISITIIFFMSSVDAFQKIDPSKGFVLTNDYVQYAFEPDGMGLSGMIDRQSGMNHIQSVEGKHSLWEVAFAKGTQIVRITNNYKPCNFAYIQNLPNGSQLAVMEWNELRWWEEDSVVTVQVTVELPKDCGIAKWRIFVENLSDYWGLWTVSCPMVNGFPASGKYDIARPVFASGGNLLKNWTRTVRGRYPSGGWPMQFMSLNQGDNGVYFAGMDADARGKDFLVDPGKQQLAMVHYVDNMGMAGSDYPDYYPVAFGIFRGGWLEAAHIYRPWALKQKWTQKGPVSQRTDIPDIAKNVGLWMQDDNVWDISPGETNVAELPSGWIKKSGDPHEMNQPFIEVQKRMGVPMAIHWYGWHHMTFDNEYPHFLPALPGFRERVKELVDTGLLIMPYINGYSADYNIPDFDKFAPHASLDEGGGFRQSFYWDGAGRLLAMCPSQEFWHDAISTLVDSLVGYCGVNGVYIDQISAAGHDLCFNKNHGHPLGGGSWWTNGFRDLLRKVENVAHRKGREFVITSEGADEVFFDLLSANLTWAQPTDVEIPMMEVVYSGYTLFFASPCDYKKSDRFFNYAQGQALIHGRQNGWMAFDMFKPQYASKVDFFKQCGQYRVALKKYLTFGRLIQPIKPNNSVPSFSEEEFGWGQTHAGTVPCAEAMLWQAEDGSLGVLMSNYVNEPVSLSYTIDPLKYGLKGNKFQLTEITPDGKIPLAIVSGAIERTEQLSPAKIKVIEIAPAGY